jgi:hypothetical protein
MKSEKKNITLDDLALMLKRQFDSIDLRFASVDARFASVDARFDLIDARLEKMATKEDLKSITDRLDRRIEAIEDIILNDHRLRIKNLEKEVGKTGIW